MKIILSLAFALCINFTLQAQTIIINKYAQVLGIAEGSCTNSIFIDSPLLFDVGDAILIIQMKGATIDSSNSSSFGTITSYVNTGIFEFNEVKAKSGTELFLKSKVLRKYDISGGAV